MDDFQDSLARMGLAVLADHGFALAGGYALQAHHLVDRMSEDIDLFTDRWDAGEFSGAVDAVAAAYSGQGLDVTETRRAGTFARLQVTDPTSGTTTTVDLAADHRHLEPVKLAVGPVLAERDAVASKVGAVFGRGEARDYLDLVGILESGRFTREELLRLGAETDAGFNVDRFAEALAAIDRFPDSEFAGYGVDEERVHTVRETTRDWSHELQSRDE